MKFLGLPSVARGLKCSKVNSGHFADTSTQPELKFYGIGNNQSLVEDGLS